MKQIFIPTPPATGRICIQNSFEWQNSHENDGQDCPGEMGFPPPAPKASLQLDESVSEVELDTGALLGHWCQAGDVEGRLQPLHLCPTCAHKKQTVAMSLAHLSAAQHSL